MQLEMMIYRNRLEQIMNNLALMTKLRVSKNRTNEFIAFPSSDCCMCGSKPVSVSTELVWGWGADRIRVGRMAPVL